MEDFERIHTRNLADDGVFVNSIVSATRDKTGVGSRFSAITETNSRGPVADGFAVGLEDY